MKRVDVGSHGCGAIIVWARIATERGSPEAP